MTKAFLEPMIIKTESEKLIYRWSIFKKKWVVKNDKNT